LKFSWKKNIKKSLKSWVALFFVDVVSAHFFFYLLITVVKMNDEPMSQTRNIWARLCCVFTRKKVTEGICERRGSDVGAVDAVEIAAPGVTREELLELIKAEVARCITREEFLELELIEGTRGVTRKEFLELKAEVARCVTREEFLELKAEVAELKGLIVGLKELIEGTRGVTREEFLALKAEVAASRKEFRTNLASDTDAADPIDDFGATKSEGIQSDVEERVLDSVADPVEDLGVTESQDVGVAIEG